MEEARELHAAPDQASGAPDQTTGTPPQAKETPLPTKGAPLQGEGVSPQVKGATPQVKGAPRRFSGWTFFLVLIGLYGLLKLQTGWYGLQIRSLERQIDRLRPALNSILLTRQLQEAHQTLSDAFEEIRRIDLSGAPLLEVLSRQTSLSITLTQLEMNPWMDLKIRGTLYAGIRGPEALLALWVQGFGESWGDVKVKELFPDGRVSGLWHFELRAKRKEH